MELNYRNGIKLYKNGKKSVYIHMISDLDFRKKQLVKDICIYLPKMFHLASPTYTLLFSSTLRISLRQSQKKKNSSKFPLDLWINISKEYLIFFSDFLKNSLCYNNFSNIANIFFYLSPFQKQIVS